MPGPLSNPQYERFAQELFKGAKPTDAQVAAGFKRHSSNAHRMSQYDNIRARVIELQTEAAARIVEEHVAIDKRHVLQNSARVFKASMAVVDAGYDAAAANAALRANDQMGGHVDVQAWKTTQDVNINVTLDDAIRRLESLDAAIEGKYEVVEGSD